MRIEGQCDFCKGSGDWEAGLFRDKGAIKDRPMGWAALFPYNKSRLPEGCTFSPESLERHRIGGVRRRYLVAARSPK